MTNQQTNQNLCLLIYKIEWDTWIVMDNIPTLNSIEIRSFEWEWYPYTRSNPSSSDESSASHLETLIKVYAPSSSNAGEQEDQEMEGPPFHGWLEALTSEGVNDSNMEVSW